jgi:hypothetical protein
VQLLWLQCTALALVTMLRAGWLLWLRCTELVLITTLQRWAVRLQQRVVRFLWLQRMAWALVTMLQWRAVQRLRLQCSALARMTAMQRRAVRLLCLQRMALVLLWPRRMALALVTWLRRQEVSPGPPPSMSAVSPCMPFMPLRVKVLWRQCTAMALVTAR